MTTAPRYPDIKPQTSTDSLDRSVAGSEVLEFSVEAVAPLVGMSVTYIRRVIGAKRALSAKDVVALLDLDAFSETFVPRSKVIDALRGNRSGVPHAAEAQHVGAHCIVKGDAKELIRRLEPESVNCVVTSTPYWGMRIYDTAQATAWADGEVCPFGHEQTPEGFIRHSCELLFYLKSCLSQDGSIWWNLMDTFNTRTQIRSNAAEALRAMQGKDTSGWHDHECRRYSAGHSFLEDGEICFIPQRIAERASRMGFWVKSIITWAKTGSMPEPQNSRVSRNLEYIIHISKQRTPAFFKEAYRTFPPHLGGRNPSVEPDKLCDVWQLPTSSGRDGHGAQFPLALPARCIGISTKPGDTVLDPFCGSGTTGVAAAALDRTFLGFDVSEKYIELAIRRLTDAGVRQAEIQLA